MTTATQNAETEEKIIQIRAGIPEKLHTKVKAHQRRLSAAADKDLTFEHALVDMLRKFKIKT